jgi:sulfopyruvate decarboxylase subunit beta
MFRDPVMTRYDAIRAIADVLDDEAVVANIGVPSKELYAANDRDLNFYMLGSYTQATPIGLGLALAADRDVVVLDGDGSLLGTAVLPVVAAEAPENLTIVCLDNGAFGSTGSQPTPAARLVDMELLARATGIRNTRKVQDERELGEAWEERGDRGPRFIHAVLKPGNAAVPNIPLNPAEIRERFVRALGG